MKRFLIATVLAVSVLVGHQAQARAEGGFGFGIGIGLGFSFSGWKNHGHPGCGSGCGTCCGKTGCGYPIGDPALAGMPATGVPGQALAGYGMPNYGDPAAAYYAQMMQPYYSQAYPYYNPTYNTQMAAHPTQGFPGTMMSAVPQYTPPAYMAPAATQPAVSLANVK